MGERLPFEQCERLEREYVCSRCWGMLRVHGLAREDGVLVASVECPKHPDAGFVSAAWVERQRAEDMAAAVEARANLKDALGLEDEFEGIDPFKALGF